MKLKTQWTDLAEGRADPPILGRFLRVFGVDALVKISGLILLPLYLTLMTQEEYATFSYLASLISVLALVCNFGLYVSQSKLFHDVEVSKRKSLLLTINLMMVGFLIVLGIAMYAWNSDEVIVKKFFSTTVDYDQFRYLIPAGVVIAVYSKLLLNYFLTSENISRVQAYNLARLILGMVLTLGALYWAQGDRAEIRLVAFILAELSVLAFFIRFYIQNMGGEFRMDLAVNSLRLGLPIMMSAVLGIFTNFGDKYFIERYCSLGDLAVYFLALTFAGVIPAVFMAFQDVWFPIFLKEKNLDLNVTRTRKTILRLFVMLSLLSAFVWLAVSIALKVGVLNESYSAVLGVLPLLLVAAVFSSLVGLLSNFTVYWGMTHITIFAGVVLAIISIPLNYIAVQTYGIYGIAIASIVINLLYGVVYFAFIRYQLAFARMGRI